MENSIVHSVVPTLVGVNRLAERWAMTTMPVVPTLVGVNRPTPSPIWLAVALSPLWWG